jgi:ABC-2 type transport system ATP-binding protein
MKPPAFVDVRRLHINYQLSPTPLRLMGLRQEEKSILQNVSFQLPLGTHSTLFGREASGKSTLLRALSGNIKPSSGSIKINGQNPALNKDLSAGYVSIEETEPNKETCHQILTSFAKTHQIESYPARINQITDWLNMSSFLFIPAQNLSTSQRLKLNIARAALSYSPLILLDDVADFLGPRATKNILDHFFSKRTAIVSTRLTKTAENLSLPILLLHKGTMSHYGSLEDIATKISSPRIVEAWIEGLRYDLLRKLRSSRGVAEARLIPTSRFSGQRLRITIYSSHYLPSVYDLISQADLVRVEEIPPSLVDVLNRL